MADVRITDLVDPEAIQNIKDLDAELKAALATYTKVAKELAQGLTVEIKVGGDIDKLEKLLAEKGKEAADAQQKLTDVMQRQQQAIANTTNTISRQLMEQERVNKLTRENYTEQEKVQKLLEHFHDTYEEQTKSLVRINRELEQNKKAQKDNEKALASGSKSMDQFTAKQARLIAEHRALTQEKRTLTQVMAAQEKAAQSQEGSYVAMSQQLELLKKAYKDLSEEGRNSEFGKELEASIQNLDAHLKDMAADMGEFQRNVGNYAIAGQQGVVSTESVVAAMNQEAQTTKDLIDQTKILEEAKTMLNTSDEKYGATIEQLNAKVEENKRKLNDVSDIMNKDATSVAEAEEQNKRLQEALKHVDLTSVDAKETIQKLNDKIEENEKIIKDNTKANEGLAGTLLGMIGINDKFGSSLRGLEGAKTGNVLDGLNTKVKAFGKTLTGLLANPWVLAFLGIAGVVAGFKWWYEYNKGLIEASKQTANFTGATGEAADKVTSDMSALADHMGKDYTDTISSVNVLVQQFGLSWEEANGLMKDAIQAGADMGGNLVANINRFAPALRDAGVSAEEFMAILSETRNGIFSEDGVQDILKAGTKLKAQTKQISEALDAVGISSEQMQKDLEEGNITMFEAVQQVAAKLKELPENSQEAGQLMKNVFGHTAAEGGTLLIQSIADINTNLDEAKKKTGEWGEATRKQLDAEQELSETVNALFKMSGTSFEDMIANAKAFVAQGLTLIIKKCVDIANWFINMYNEALYVRVSVASIVAVFKTLWTIAKSLFSMLIAGFKGVGGVIEGIMLIFSGELKEGLHKIRDALSNEFNSIKDTAINAGKEIGKNFADSLSGVAERRLKTLSVTLSPDETTTTKVVNGGGGGGDNKDKGGDKDKGGGKDKGKDDSKSKSEAEKAAKEALKVLFEVEESKIALMKEGHEKEIAIIKLNFKKKIEEITGNSEQEKQLRINLLAQMEQEIAECELKYQQEMAKINLENRLASVEKGSKEEFDLKMAQIEKSRNAELAEAEKTGADVNLINAKFNREREDLQEEYNENLLNKIQQRYADEQTTRDNEMMAEINTLQRKYAKELELVGSNEARRAELKERFEAKSAEITEKYAIQSARAAVRMFEELLKTDNLTAEERERLERELAAAKIALEKSVTDATIEENERKVKSDKEATEKRIANAQQWLQIASDSLNAINDLVGTVYDAKIAKVEEEQEANEDAAEKEQERISRLVEQKVITEEEGEARKRAAEAKTAKKNEELERKKAKLKQKQAVWDKVNSIAQAGIATALAITQALPNLVLAAIAGAMGAMQIATIIATPIPQYAKGTDRHKGGPAIVGDGGVSELVMFGGNAWITPDKPTLVDLPAGAAVIPEVPLITMSDFSVPQPVGNAPANTPKGYNDVKVVDRLDNLIEMKRRESKAKREADIDRQLTMYLLGKNI